MSFELKDAVPAQGLRRVLVVKLAHLGDVLLVSPVLSVLKARAPHAEVDALVYTDTAPMLENHPALSQLFTLRRGNKLSGLGGEISLLKKLRGRRYDLVVALSDKPRIAWMTRISGARYAVTPARPDRPGFWQRSFTHFYPLPRGNTRHTVEVHLDALRRLGLRPEAGEKRLVMVPGREAEERVGKLMAQHALEAKRFVQMHPASRWLFKCWPADRVAELINLLHSRGERIVLTGAGDGNEAAYMDEVRKRLRQPVVDLAGQLDLKALAALAARARLFVGVDSAPMHIASAMGTPVVALFGPSGDVEWGPWQVAHRIVASDMACRPCGINGCGGSNRSECLETLPLERVLAAIDEL
jgi:heptosyltransferase-3